MGYWMKIPGSDNDYLPSSYWSDFPQAPKTIQAIAITLGYLHSKTTFLTLLYTFVAGDRETNLEFTRKLMAGYLS